MIDVIDAGDLEAIAQALDARPRLLHTHAPYRRDWGEELWLPIHQAVRLGRLEVLGLLLDRGAKPDSRTRFPTPEHGRATALHVAAEFNRPDAVRMLLDAGATPYVLDAYQRTPASIARTMNHNEVLSVLQPGGDDPIASSN